MMTWDDLTIHMKDPESLLDLLDPVNDFSGITINMRQKHSMRLLSISRKFLMQSMNRRTLMQSYRHADISLKMRNVIYMPYFINMNIYLMVLWGHDGRMITLKIELEQLIKLGVLKQINASKWAAPTFIVSKKDGMVRFISDFHELNKCTKCKPFPIQKIQDLLLKLEGFQHAMSLNLNMGYYHIELMPFSKCLCTIIMPWGSPSTNTSDFLWVYVIVLTTFKSACLIKLILDLEYVQVYIDDLLVTSCLTFNEHLKHLDKVLL